MKTFLSFILEESSPGKLKHLDHPEDNAIFSHSGFTHAFQALHDVHKALKGQKHTSKITTKLDGSPSIVAGHHPETGKFFVASKSAFNKNPKINYTHEDIDRNHGHSPGLAHKLKQALDHLPKAMPKKGVYQGDFMHSHDDREHTDTQVKFKPNTITYSLKKNSEEGKKAAASKIGVAFHTKYEGKTLEDMHATPHVDHENFKQHKDVHLISPEAKL